MNPISYNPYSSYNNYYPYPSYVDYGYAPQYQQPQQAQEENPAKTVGLVALLQAIAMALPKISNYFSAKLMAGKEYTSAENVEKVVDYMKKKNNLNVDVHFINEGNKNNISRAYGLGNSLDVVAKGENAFYVDNLNLSQEAKNAGLKSKIAVAPSSKPSLIQHELGHGINATKKFTKLLQKSRRYSVYAPVALLLASKIMPQKENGQQNFIQRNAGILGFAAFLPTIIEEGLASFKGIKSAKEMLKKGLLKGPVKLNILKRNYAFALATYILAGIGLGVASKQTIIENS